MAGNVTVKYGPGGSTTVTINTTVLDQLLARAEARFARLLAAGAFEVAAVAKMSPSTPVDTGALANSIKVHKESAAVYKIGPSVHYAIYQEMGWTDRAGHWHSGRWYMTAALLATAPRIYEAVRQMFKGGGMGDSGFSMPKEPGEGK